MQRETTGIANKKLNQKSFPMFHCQQSFIKNAATKNYVVGKTFLLKGRKAQKENDIVKDGCVKPYCRTDFVSVVTVKNKS